MDRRAFAVGTLALVAAPLAAGAEAVLLSPAGRIAPPAASHRPAADALEAAALKLGVQLLTMSVRTPEDLDAAFAMMARERVNGFLAVSSPLSRAQRTRVAELALKYRVA